LNLTKACARWDQVVHINSYHIDGFPPIANSTPRNLY